uniref:pancreatic elastase n=1 Tax=Fundulus heteroclitus TaxID=8078 RepID=A0A3Q2UIU7_FUNHE
MLRFLVLTSFTALVLAELEFQPRYLKNTQGRLNAEVATPNSWPWQVKSSYIHYYHYCGGSLIQRRWVISSARCIDRWRAVQGEHDLSVRSDAEQIIAVHSIHIYPKWSGLSLCFSHDIALVKLSSEAILNSYVQLVSLPSPGQILQHNNPCYSNLPMFSPAPLKQAFAPVVDYQTCSSRGWWGTVINNGMICAGRSEISCYGYLGGPLSCQVDGKYYVHGSLSVTTGSGCDNKEKPPIFTRLSDYTDWINSVILMACSAGGK